MPAHQLVIAPAAQADLREIYQHGLRQWGQAQSDCYIDDLKEQIWTLTTHPFMGVERPELLPNIRSLTIETHILFYRVTLDTLEIIRILHGRQDPQRHLK